MCGDKRLNPPAGMRSPPGALGPTRTASLLLLPVLFAPHLLLRGEAPVRGPPPHEGPGGVVAHGLRQQAAAQAGVHAVPRRGAGGGRCPRVQARAATAEVAPPGGGKGNEMAEGAQRCRRG